MPKESKASEAEFELVLADSIVAATPIRDVLKLLCADGRSIWRSVEFTKVTDEMRVADILASWSIEELRQLIVEIDAELRRRPAPPRGALRSRRAHAARRPRRRMDSPRC
jgi:hypothetical protein